MSVVYARFATLTICEEILVWTKFPQNMEHCKALHICLCLWTFSLWMYFPYEWGYSGNVCHLQRIIIGTTCLTKLWACTHETEGPWPLQFMHSDWWKRRSRSKFALHYAWRTNGVSECKMDVESTWIPTLDQMDMFHGHLDSFQKTLLFKGRSNTKPGDHGTLKAHNCWFIIFYHVWNPYMNRNPLK